MLERRELRVRIEAIERDELPPRGGRDRRALARRDDRIADARPQRLIAVPEVHEIVVALEAGKAHLGPRTDGIPKPTCHHHRRRTASTRAPRQAVLPDRPVVLKPADEALQRIARIDRHVVELHRLQAAVHEDHATRHACQHGAALRRVDGNSVEHRLLMSTNKPSVRITPPSEPTNAMSGSCGWKTTALYVHMGRHARVLGVPAVRGKTHTRVDRPHRGFAKRRLCHAADDHGVGLALGHSHDKIIETLRRTDGLARRAGLCRVRRGQPNPGRRIRRTHRQQGCATSELSSRYNPCVVVSSVPL